MLKRAAIVLTSTLIATGLTTLAVSPVIQPATASARSAAKVTVSNGCIKSVPEPGTSAPVKICYSIFKPASASASRPVPMIMHSHGWAGSRTKNKGPFTPFTNAGYGVISFDQRGWGDSGGHANVEAPALEGVDVRRLVDLVSTLEWVQQDGPGDPRLGAIGGSYGGGYQFVGAFEELRLHGKPIFDALAPQITWNDLSGSLAPEGVVRTEWALGLSATSLISDALPVHVYQALVEGTVTGQWPDGSLPLGPLGTDIEGFFKKNGPKWHIEHGRKLDIPVLFGQGTTDTLFPLEQGLTNWHTAITSRARKDSIFVGYNGGHTLPAVLPAGVTVASDPCSKRLAGGDFEKLSVRFFDEQLKGLERNLRGYGKFHLSTPQSRCITVDSVRATQTVRLGTVASTTALGVPLPYEIAAGPITIAGSPFFTGSVTALGVENRAFYGLAVGSTPLDAHLVQNNVLPLNEPGTVTGVRRRVTLPSLAITVPQGQYLYLLVSPISDTFVAMGSRTPGLITIDDTVVHLPVVAR